MGSGGGGGDGGASAAAQADAQRRARINQGIANIDRVFAGSDAGINPVTNPAAGQTYYLADGTPITLAQITTTTPGSPGSSGSGGGGGYARSPEQARGMRGVGSSGPRGNPNGRNATAGSPGSTSTVLGYNGQPLGSTPIYGAVQHTGGFDDNFYNGIASKYDAYAMPQLDTQYKDALDELTYALARQGISNSTGAGKQQSKLDTQFNQYRTDIASQGRSYADKARADIAGVRNDLVNQVTATENPAAATTAALAEAAIMNQPPVFSPVGAFTFNVGSGLVNGINNGGFSPPASSPYTTSPYSVASGNSRGGSVKYVS